MTRIERMFTDSDPRRSLLRVVGTALQLTGDRELALRLLRPVRLLVDLGEEVVRRLVVRVKLDGAPEHALGVAQLPLLEEVLPSRM